MAKHTQSANPVAARSQPLARTLLSIAALALLQAVPSLGSHASFVPSPGPSDDAQALLATPPRAVIVDVAANEIRAIQHKDSFIRYRMHTRDAKGDRVRDIIESKDGSVARLILKDGRPLTPEEDQAERDRLNDLLASPSEFSKHVRNDLAGKKLAIDLIQLMPDAMIYVYVPGQPQLQPARGTRQIVVDYTPNPHWSPPSTTAEALTGLRGRMWIDPGTRQLLRMEGNIFQGVNLGWGMLAHIYPGGNLALDQTDVGGGRWIFSRFLEQIKVRALMVKSLNIDTTIEASGFQQLPAPVSYADAIRMLLSAPPPTRADAASANSVH